MRWITSLIALALAVALLGCGSDSDDSDDSNESDEAAALATVEQYVTAWQDGDGEALCDVAVWGTSPIDEIDDPSEELSDALDEFRATCADDPEAFGEFVEQSVGRIRSFEVGDVRLDGDTGSVDVSMAVRIPGGERRDHEFAQDVVKVDDEWLAYSQGPS